MKCPECEKNVSAVAVACPHCGFVLEETKPKEVIDNISALRTTRLDEVIDFISRLKILVRWASCFAFLFGFMYLNEEIIVLPERHKVLDHIMGSVGFLVFLLTLSFSYRSVITFAVTAFFNVFIIYLIFQPTDFLWGSHWLTNMIFIFPTIVIFCFSLTSGIAEPVGWYPSKLGGGRRDQAGDSRVCQREKAN